jgi:hypothetical protein
MRRHRVPVQYTNIFLMKATNLLLCGEAIGDTSAVDDGKKMLDDWLAFTGRYGVIEYDSPVYSNIDLNCVTAGYNHTRDPHARAALKTILDYLWADVSANYFAGQESLTGAHSRDYSFVDSVGMISWAYYLVGLSDHATAVGLFNEMPDTWTNAAEGPYEPPEAIVSLGRIPTRLIRQRVGEKYGQDRYTWITPDFSIGSASAYYGTQDKLVNCELASAKRLCNIVLIADGFDAPYGRVKRPDRAGHNKPVLIERAVTTVQERGIVLAMLNLTGAKNNENQSVATNVLIPARAEAIYVDGALVSLSAPIERALSVDSVVTVKEGNGAVAVRFLHADAATEHAVQYWLKWDGNDAGAARVVAYHSTAGRAEPPRQPVRAAVLLVAKSCGTDAELDSLTRSLQTAKINDSTEDSLWHLSVTVDGVELAGGQDLRNATSTDRKVNGQEMKTENFLLNDRDLAKELIPSSERARP